MRGLDPRLRPHLAPAHSWLAAVVCGQVVVGLLVIAQGFAVGSLVVGVVRDPAGATWHAAAWWTLALLAARALAAYAVETSASAAAGVVTVTLRRRVLEAVLALDPAALSRRRRGELAALATRGMASLEPYVTRYLPAMVTAAVLPAVTLVVITWLDWLSGLIVLLTMPLVPLFAALIGMATRDRADRQWRALGALAGHFLDVVRGLPTLVAYRRATAQSARIRRITDDYRRVTLDTLRLAFSSSAVLELIATVSVALVAVSVGLRLAGGSLDFRTALVVLLLAPEAYWPLRRVGVEFHAAAEGTAAWRAAADLLGEAGAGRGLPATESAQRGGVVVVEGLTLGYAGRSSPVVEDLTASLPSPGMTAVVGPSGCGKSTLLAALLGELTPRAGRVLVGGAERVADSLDDWRAQVAWAPQRPWLTAASIAENVAVGCPGASVAEIWRVLEQVELADAVAKLPDGLETPLGEDGAGLSAGERARVALARVLLADRPYVFLDEPSAHLDAATEAVILRVLRDLATRACVIVVAHRPAVVAAADHVVELGEPVRHAPPPDEVRRALRREPRSEGARRDSDRAIESERRSVMRAGLRERSKHLRHSLLVGTALGALSTASGVALTATAAWLITRAAERPPVLYLMVAIVAVRTFGLARPALRYAERLVSHDAALRLLAERRAQVYDALVPLVPGRLGRRRGDLLASVVDDVDSVVDDHLRVRQPLWTAAVVGVLAVVTAALVVPVAGGVLLALLTATAAATWLAHAGARALEPAIVHHRADVSTAVTEAVDDARELVLWQTTGPALAAVDREGRALAQSSLRAARALALARVVPLLAAGCAMVATAALVPPGAPSAAMTALLVLLPLALVDALVPVTDAAALRVRTGAAVSRLDTLVAAAPAVSDPVLPEPVPQAPPDVRLADVSGGWTQQDAVRDLSLDLNAGGRVGLVGPSGSGKSTVAAYLLRFLDPRSGAVLLGGLDERRVRLDDVRRLVGLVDDDPYVFASTLVENVRLARPEAADDEVAVALAAAGLGPWLSGLPDGLDTWLGHGGAAVSGGERARIGIARALLADPPVLVLDEPTAHLDSETARRVTAEVLGTTRGRSVLWITHSTIGLDAMDNVLRLETPPRPGGASYGLRPRVRRSPAARPRHPGRRGP